MKIKNSFLLLVSLLILLSCNSESKSHLKFRFRVVDTVAEYRIYFYTRVLSDFKKESLPLVMTVMSPDGKRFRDTISFPLVSKNNYGGIEEAKSGVWRDVRWLYRDGVTFPKTGLWIFTINHLTSKNDLSSIGELGLTLKEK